ncbi:MAG: Asp-tRNA(Asn)/Glu-tRNA(Gln) amidotransferase subunit GatB [Candidatus Woesearchaeota archaeon]
MTKIKIGLEIHGYINTDSKRKLFCNCKTDQTSEANTNICPVCTSQPGSKPMLPNNEALKKIIAISLMLGCKVNQRLIFQRKHYSWPDLPSGYQKTISGAYSHPVGINGNFLDIGISDVHLEEDPAKWDPVTGCVDYNRSGYPLVEIVTEPDFRSVDELREWLKNLVTTLSYIKAIDKDSGIKSDVNVSIEPKYKRVEIKNVNSFSSIVSAAEYEVERQKEVVDKGEDVKQETRTWDEKTGKTLFMRSKENAADYMFIPEPDLPVISIENNTIKDITKILPELPSIKKERYEKKHNLKKEDAYVISSNIYLAEIFEEAIKNKIDPKIAVRWLRRELLRVANFQKKDIDELPITNENMINLMNLIKDNKITEKVAQKIIEKLSQKTFDVKEYVKKNNLETVSDSGEIEKFCKEAIDENPNAITDYKNGKENALNFLMGQVMRKSRGKASPNTVIPLLKKLIK